MAWQVELSGRATCPGVRHEPSLKVNLISLGKPDARATDVLTGRTIEGLKKNYGDRERSLAGCTLHELVGRYTW